MGRTLGIVLNLKDRFSGVLNGAGKNAKKFAAQLHQSKKLISGMENSLLKVGKATAAFSAIGIGTGMKSFADYDSAVRQVATSTGKSLEGMKQLKNVMQDVYSNNYGENWEDVGNSVATVQKYLGKTGESIQQATKNAISLRDTFGTDVTESMRSVDALMKNFGISSNEAFNLIGQGAQQNLDFSGELVDSINEYSSQVKKLGLSAEDMFGIFASGAENGAWNVDKIGDALKEFSIRSIDGSKTTLEGFKAIGKNAGVMAQKFTAGGETARNAFFETIQGLKQMDNAVEQDAAGVALFGTMWEDLGKDVVLNMDKMGGAFDKNRQTMLEINKIKYSSFSKAITGIGRQLSVAFIPIGETILPCFNTFANWLSNKLPSAIKGFTDILNNVPQKIEKFAGKLINSFEKEDVNRVFVKLKQNVFKGSEETKKAFQSIGLDADEMKKKFLEGGDSAKQAFSETIKRLRELDDEKTRAFAGNTLFGTMWQDLGKDAILSMSNMRSFLAGKIFSFLKEKFQYLKNHMQEVKAVVAGLAGAFVGLKTITVTVGVLKKLNEAGGTAKFIFNALKTSLLANPFVLTATAIGVLVGAFVLLYQKSETFRNGIQQLWGRLKEFGAVIGGEVIGILQQLHSWFGEKIAPMLSQIGQSFIELCQSPIVSWFADVFVSGIGVAVQNFFNIVNAVLPHIQGVIEGLLTSFNGILTFLSGVFSLDWQKAWQGVKDIFYGIVQSIGNIFGAIIEKIKGRINGITGQINNVAQKMSNIPVIGGLVQKINIPQFATGTQYFKGGTALVGEHGAELIDMPSGSKVTPADKTKQILKSGNPIAINITVQGNMIGNEQYANQLGNIIIQKIMTAQYNV